MRRWFWIALLATGALAQPPNGVWVVGHRGFKAVAPENTIASFEAAAAAGADYMETDVRQTKDGELVLVHDSTVDRTTNGKGAVRDLTLAEIRKLDAGNGQRVPTLREALLWAKNRGVRIDIDHKDGAADAIARVVRETGMTQRVVIEGPRERLKRFVELLPGVDTMPKVESAADVLEACKMLHTTVVRLSLEQLYREDVVAAVRDCKARVSVTILGKTDTEETMHVAIMYGAQLIETDHPDLVAKVRSTRATVKKIETPSDGSLEITLSDGMTLHPPLLRRDESDELGGPGSYSAAAISDDGSAGGWLVAFRWPGVTYAVPQEVALYRPGGALRWIRPEETNFMVLSAWGFVRGGKQVALRRAPLHGPGEPMYELHNAETGKLVAQSAGTNVPAWAAAAKVR